MLIPRNLKNKIEKVNNFKKNEHSEDELRFFLETYYSALAENILSFAKSRTATKQDTFLKKNIVIYSSYIGDDEDNISHIIPLDNYSHGDWLTIDKFNSHYEDFHKTYTVSYSPKSIKDDGCKTVINGPNLTIYKE
ncbi:hypothetical protein ACK3Z0_11640 [Aeromonas caviae]